MKQALWVWTAAVSLIIACSLSAIPGAESTPAPPGPTKTATRANRETAAPAATDLGATSPAATEPGATSPATAIPPTAAGDEPRAYLPSATPADNPIRHLQKGQGVVITYIRMINRDDGWAVGGLERPGVHVLRTRDGGITWSDVTPPEAPAQPGTPGKTLRGAFLDELHARVVYYSRSLVETGDRPVVWITQDGGESWQASAPLDTGPFYLPPALAEPVWFAGLQNGWLMENLHDAGMQKTYVNLYRTEDGGMTWERIIDPTGGGLQAAGKNAVVFADGQTGLATYNQGPYESVYVTWTSDGGASWAFKALPEPEAGAFTHSLCESHSPHFFSRDSLGLAVTCRTFEGDGPPSLDHYLYRTADRGGTWQIDPYPGGALQFAGPDVVWALGTDIYRSLDGGSIWALAKTVAWDGQFSFVDETYGWAVATAGEEVALVRTTNGGETWSIIEPQIAP